MGAFLYAPVGTPVAGINYGRPTPGAGGPTVVLCEPTTDTELLVEKDPTLVPEL